LTLHAATSSGSTRATAATAHGAAVFSSAPTQLAAPATFGQSASSAEPAPEFPRTEVAPGENDLAEVLVWEYGVEGPDTPGENQPWLRVPPWAEDTVIPKLVAGSATMIFKAFDENMEQLTLKHFNSARKTSMCQWTVIDREFGKHCRYTLKRKDVFLHLRRNSVRIPMSELNDEVNNYWQWCD
jgi:hypothetical protein